jgi:serine/threonine protein kinase
MHDNASVQVLGQVLKAVKALHGAGYAHRNIKPSNIQSRLKQHDWVLFDFASSAPLSAPPFWTSTRVWNLLHRLCTIAEPHESWLCIAVERQASKQVGSCMQIRWHLCPTAWLPCHTPLQKSSKTCGVPQAGRQPLWPQVLQTSGHWEWLPSSC